MIINYLMDAQNCKTTGYFLDFCKSLAFNLACKYQYEQYIFKNISAYICQYFA